MTPVPPYIGNEPVYLSSQKNGSLHDKVVVARRLLGKCTLCPRKCSVDRLSGETGYCRTGRRAWVASASPHFGEESPLVGTGGSGTIFFSHCSLGCIFCQNYDISQGSVGEPVSDDHLAGIMLALQDAGCHNINLVTPTHVVPQILAALEIAVQGGLHIPLVYNTSAYDRMETIKLLEDTIDIFMPDFKFWESGVAESTCNAPDYPEAAKTAITEMHRQVGDLIVNSDGIAVRGLLLRHLVLPQELAGTREVMKFVYDHISPHTYVNIMPQYRPCGKAEFIKDLGKPLSPNEFKRALKIAEFQGILRWDRRRRTFFLW